ncbi:hypothetical protein DER45DRAFT_575760 [Fusarium avenaceum]|nr:hypothetical protein DER45DRAFT_575760 [Fusarium avenaceum]
MKSLRRVQSESSMGRQRTLETHPECCTQKQSKQHPQVQPHHPTPTTPAKLECCEKSVNQNKELQNILQKQEEQIESLQDTVSSLIEKNKLLMSNLSERIEDSVQLRLKIASSNQELHNALENTRVMSYTVHELEDQISQLKQIHGSKTTPRTIIISKLLSKSCEYLEASGGKGVRVSTESVSSRVFTNLKDTLDTVLSADEIQHLLPTFEQWLGGEELNSVSLVTCCECKKVKFKRAISSKGVVCINEFITTYPGFACIYSICSLCFFKSLSYSFELFRETWWKTRGSIIYIPCPCGRCGRDIPLQSRGTLVKLLCFMEDKCLGERNIRSYDTALELMKALDGIIPQLTLNARNVAARMHRKLIANNFMHSPFDLRFRDLTHNEVGSPLKANSTLFSLYNIDHAGEALRIPVFNRFLRIEPTSIECVICTDSYHEVFYGSLEEWTKVCSEFEGDWIWKILIFPQKLHENCSHIIDFCTGCLQQHLQTQLDQFGRSAYDNITCPSQECQRLLTYEEIQLYAKEETFHEYDEYLKLKALSQMPSFMWCLAEKCSSGQIHDLIFDSHVSCAECEFEMCFTHQVKWHEGLTCEQYESLKRTGDPESEETQKWIATNTKPCPECGIHVQKGNGCFHMTCSLCHHEFCWEYLASWRDIRSGSGGYNRSAHNDGCYFKTSSHQPTEVIGSTIPVTG